MKIPAHTREANGRLIDTLLSGRAPASLSPYAGARDPYAVRRWHLSALDTRRIANMRRAPVQPGARP